MRAHSLAVTLFVVFFGLRTAFPQAAAESVLLHGNSATATAKAGTALGNALNKAANQVGSQIPTAPQSKVVVHKVPPIQQTKIAPATTTKPNTGASMIVSIQGGRITHSATAPAPATPASH